MINLLKETAQMKEVLHRCTKIPAHNRPCLFVKEGGIAIRPRGFIIANTKDCLADVLMSHRR
jgi:hypothetical protein